MGSLVSESDPKWVVYSPCVVFFAAEWTAEWFVPEEGVVDGPCNPRQHKTASFLSAHPVFTRAEFAAAFGHLAAAANVTSLLRHHLRAGNIKRVSREVFAAVPAHLGLGPIKGIYYWLRVSGSAVRGP
jgi:hypothetical protein